MTDFVNSHAHQILQHVDYFVVTHSHGKYGLFKHLANNAANFLKISNGLVHYKLCELIQRKWNVAEVPKTLVDILAQSPNQRYSN